MLFTYLASALTIIPLGVMAGILGNESAATEWFTSQVTVNKANQSNSKEAFAMRTYFYVGGHYLNTSAGQFMVDQMYVEKLIPIRDSSDPPKHPIVFTTGAWQTATNFLNTPDGRKGWASYFLDKGYTVYLVDQPQRGRSPWLPSDGEMQMNNVTFAQEFFTTVQNFNAWPQAHLHTQWPGTGLVGDPTFDAFFASQVQEQANDTEIEVINVNALVALLDKIGEAVVLTHSRGGPFGWGIGDRRPELVKAIVAIEPSGPPFVSEIISTGPARPYGITTLPITYNPPVDDPAVDLLQESIPPANANVSACIQQKEPAKQLVKLSQIPVLFYTSEASYHAFYDYCTYNYMIQAGMQVDRLNLPDVGIHGNAHFSFMEKNNMVTAIIVEAWVRKAIEN